MKVILVLVVLFLASCSSDNPVADRPGNTRITGPSESQPDYKACGFINDAQVDCDEEQICATVSWRPDDGPRCYPQNICEIEKPCGDNSQCLVLESWPAQIHCGT